jgi:hypothetical protein
MSSNAMLMGMAGAIITGLPCEIRDLQSVIIKGFPLVVE